MNSITLTMPYYEQPGMLRRQYYLLSSMPDLVKRHLSVIVVDDCSETRPASKLEIGMPLEVFRIMPPKIAWNIDAARNIGVHEARTKWVLTTDIDQMVPRETWESLISANLSDGHAYKFSRVTAPHNTPCKPHTDSWLMTTSLYWAAGRDERFAGHYATDADFRDRVRQRAEIIWRPEITIDVGTDVEPDAATTQFERKTAENRIPMRKIVAERNAIPGWRPLMMTFPYERVA